MGSVRDHNAGHDVRMVRFYEGVSTPMVIRTLMSSSDGVNMVSVAVARRTSNYKSVIPAVVIGASAPHRRGIYDARACRSSQVA